MDRESFIALADKGRVASEFKKSQLASELLYEKINLVSERLCNLQPYETDRFVALCGARVALEEISLAIENMIATGIDAGNRLSGAVETARPSAVL